MTRRLRTVSYEEAQFLRKAFTDALDQLHTERRAMSEAGNMVRLMDVEKRLSVAESAWQKVKEMLFRS